MEIQRRMKQTEVYYKFEKEQLKNRQKFSNYEKPFL